MLNSALISPRYSPIFSLLSPPCSIRNLATDLGSSSIKVCEMRYSIPRLGFLGKKEKRKEERGGEGGKRDDHLIQFYITLFHIHITHGMVWYVKLVLQYTTLMDVLFQLWVSKSKIVLLVAHLLAISVVNCQDHTPQNNFSFIPQNGDCRCWESSQEKTEPIFSWTSPKGIREWEWEGEGRVKILRCFPSR